MNIQCNKSNLLHAINIVSKAVNTKSTMEILSCLLLVADREGFRLIANDLKLSIETANIESEMYVKGSVALDARLFSEIIRKLPTDFVTIEVDENFNAKITSGKSIFNIKGQNPEQFPMPEVLNKNIGEVSIPSLVLKSMIKKTIFSVAADENRPILTGEQIKFDEGFINIAAIDGCRVSWRMSKVDYNNYNEMVVPAKTLNELVRLLPDDDNVNVKLIFSSMHIMFKFDQGTMVSRLLDGDFLNYESLFNGDSPLVLTVDRLDILSALERATIVSDDVKKTDVRLTIRDNFVNIAASSSFGNVVEDVAINLESGEELTINFNARFLIDVMSACDEEYIKLMFNTNKSPCILTGVTDESYKYLVLPISPKGQ